MASFSALLDANVIHPIVQCDLLLRLAEKGLYRPLWSAEILHECERSMTGWESLARVLSDEFAHDAHVVAAAITGRADVIVTENVRHFPLTPTLRSHRIHVQRLDEFLVNQWWLSPQIVRAVVIEGAASRKRPTRTPQDILSTIAKTAPEFAALALAAL